MLILQDTPVGDLTRGGQIVIHFLRMLAQVLRKFGAALLLAILCATVVTFTALTSSYERYLGWRYLTSYVAVEVLKNPDQTTQIMRADGSLIDAQMSALRASATLERAAQQLLTEAKESLVIATVLVTILFSLLVAWVWRSGARQRADELLRGVEIVSAQALTQALNQHGCASDLHLGGVPLVAGTETLHIQVTGTSGTGKTQALQELMLQIRRRRERFICFSPSGDFLSQFFRPGRDHVLNPFDDRCPTWNLWDECPQPYHYDAFAATLIPDKPSTGDPFWTDAARTLVACLAQETGRRNERDMGRFLTLLTGPLADLFKYLEHTEAGPQIAPESEKPALSIRTTAVTYARSLKYLPAENAPFNIRQWVANEDTDECVFLTARDEERESVRPLLTTWLEIFTQAILSLPPDSSRRIWLIIDELAVLNRIPSLLNFQAQARKYGGCGVFSFQQLSQLRQIYNKDGAESLVGGSATWLCMRQNDPETAEWVAKAFGQTEIRESQQGLSYGANDMRDGISLSQQRKLKQNLIPSEVVQLNNLEGFIRLPGRWPVAHLKLTYREPLKRVPAVIPATSPRVWRPSGPSEAALAAPTISGDLFLQDDPDVVSPAAPEPIN